MIGEIEGLGSYVHIPRDRDYTISVRLRMLTLRHLAIKADETYFANPKEHVLLQCYANAIVHLLKGKPESDPHLFVVTREGGLPSIPETVVIETISRGVLDPRLRRGDSTRMGRAKRNPSPHEHRH